MARIQVGKLTGSELDCLALIDNIWLA